MKQAILTLLGIIAIAIGLFAFPLVSIPVGLVLLMGTGYTLLGKILIALGMGLFALRLMLGVIT